MERRLLSRRGARRARQGSSVDRGRLAFRSHLGAARFAEPVVRARCPGKCPTTGLHAVDTIRNEGNTETKPRGVWGSHDPELSIDKSLHPLSIGLWIIAAEYGLTTHHRVEDC